MGCEHEQDGGLEEEAVVGIFDNTNAAEGVTTAEEGTSVEEEFIFVLIHGV